MRQALYATCLLLIVTITGCDLVTGTPRASSYPYFETTEGQSDVTVAIHFDKEHGLNQSISYSESSPGATVGGSVRRWHYGVEEASDRSLL